MSHKSFELAHNPSNYHPIKIKIKIKITMARCHSFNQKGRQRLWDMEINPMNQNGNLVTLPSEPDFQILRDQISEAKRLAEYAQLKRDLQDIRMRCIT